VFLVAVAMALGLCAPEGHAAPAEAEQAVVDHLRARETILAEHAAAASTLSRQHTLTAYRLVRRRQIGFLTNPFRRRADAEAAGLAMAVVRRSLREAAINRDELARVRAEREALEKRLGRRRDADSAPAPPEGTTVGRGPARIGRPSTVPHFMSPVPGPVVATPGLHRDQATDADLRRVGLQILARFNAPVRAPAAGMVRRVARLPHGGFAVVTAHADGWVSILSGMREVEVAERQPVIAGHALGFAGRTLDGATVVKYELWHDRVPVDPRATR
jgi:septal ring factor EnvC (AmiA/AmiB activator)